MRDISVRLTAHEEELDLATSVGLQDWQWYSDQAAVALINWWKSAAGNGSPPLHQRIVVNIHHHPDKPLVFFDVSGSIEQASAS